MSKSDSIWIVVRVNTYHNGEQTFTEVGYYTMKSLAVKQVRYLNGTVGNSVKNAMVYSAMEVEANHDFSQ
jgi:hypothetical protein